MKRGLLASAFMFSAVAGAMAADPVGITLWHMEQPPHRVARVQELIDEFNAANPDIVVKQEPQNWGEIYAKAPAAIAAGNAPDILFAIPDFTTVIRKVDSARLRSRTSSTSSTPSIISFRPRSSPTNMTAASGRCRSTTWRSQPLVPEERLRQGRPQGADDLERMERGRRDAVHGRRRTAWACPPTSSSTPTRPSTRIMVNNGGASETLQRRRHAALRQPEDRRRLCLLQGPVTSTRRRTRQLDVGRGRGLLRRKNCGMVLQFTVITHLRRAGRRRSPPTSASRPSRMPTSEAVSNTISYSNAAMILAKDPAKRAGGAKVPRLPARAGELRPFLNMEPGLFLPVDRGRRQGAELLVRPAGGQVQVADRDDDRQQPERHALRLHDGHVFPSIGAISAQNILAETLQKIVIDGETPAAAVAAGQKHMEAGSKVETLPAGRRIDGSGTR